MVALERALCFEACRLSVSGRCVVAAETATPPFRRRLIRRPLSSSEEYSLPESESVVFGGGVAGRLRMVEDFFAVRFLKRATAAEGDVACAVGSAMSVMMNTGL